MRTEMEVRMQRSVFMYGSETWLQRNEDKKRIKPSDNVPEISDTSYIERQTEKWFYLNVWKLKI
jgi:hypothetical protein